MLTGYQERADTGTESTRATDAAGDGDTRRAELAEFLRTRRARVTPESVGLPPGGRRRTPGLRREELAQLAGVGVTWYTWLEQGRDIRPSAQVLEAIARTLRLDRDERAHLFALADATSAVPEQDHAVGAGLLRILEAVLPYPACVQSAKYDLLAYNRAYERFAGGLDRLPVTERNAVWLNFTDPTWRSLLVDWDDTAGRMVAQLRARLADHTGDASWRSFLDRLSAASPEFVAMWQRHEVTRAGLERKRVRAPGVGRLNFDITSTWLEPRQGTRLTVFTPADDQTAAKLPQLIAAD